MAWFNVLKGAYPSLQQVDKVLNCAVGETGIVRGSLIYQDGMTWKLATATQNNVPSAYIHFALMSQTDLTAGMAGGIGQGVGSGVVLGGGVTAGLGTARINGLAVGMPFEFETDQFVTTAQYTVGQLLTVANGGLLTAHSTGLNCIAQVTKVTTTRWVNSAIAVTGWRLGANVSVLTARTLWIPKLTV